MIQKIKVLEEVLENIEPFNTKDEIIHEIRTMLAEAEEELHRESIDYLKSIIEDEESTPEEKEEAMENLRLMQEE